MKRKDRILVGFIIPILVIVGSLAYFALENINVKGNDEWSNNATLIAEIGVGAIITLLVLLVTKLNEIKIEEKIISVFDIVTEQEKVRKEKEYSIQSRLYKTFVNMNDHLSQILANVDAYNKTRDSSLMEKYKNQIISDCSHISLLSEEYLDDSTLISTEFFNFNTIKRLKTISAVCKNKPTFDDENKVNVSYCTPLRDMIQPCIDDLAKKLNVKPIPPTQPSDDSVSILVSVDRTVYPLDSIIHAQAELDNIIKGKLITYEIFNSKRKLLMSQTVDPATYDDSHLVGSNIFQTNFQMKGKEWKIGNEYILRATHGSSCAEDSFLIDQRIPVVQSDKSVYVIGSDMIITVIDPDADKDNQVAEYVGDREHSKLVIESPYGKIDGYRLRETGNSTGIFQGIIGILGIRKNGTVIPQKFDDKLIDKIQGTAIDDGFIGGIIGDELTATYTNKAGTTKHTFFISNFGATIELDQKVYQPSDKVYITVVAPDLNFDSDKIDEIGVNPESAISIHTSKGKIDNYRLVETNNDSGIFIGEIQLETASSNSISNGNGPTDGKLLCEDDDFIEVSFIMFEDKEFVGRAKIKKTILSS